MLSSCRTRRAESIGATFVAWRRIDKILETKNLNAQNNGTETKAGKRPSFWGAPEGNAESAIQAVLIRIAENAYFDRRWPLNGFFGSHTTWNALSQQTQGEQD